MTQYEIIRMARESGAAEVYCSTSPTTDSIGFEFLYKDDSLERFAALVAAHEREACARVCEEEAEEWAGRTEPYEAVVRCAAAIRARSNT